MKPEAISGQVVGAAYPLRSRLGPGLLESVDALPTIHRQQLLTDLKVSGKPVGLLINFSAPLTKAGIVRWVNQLPAE
jgi:hypothetical protein